MKYRGVKLIAIKEEVLNIRGLGSHEVIVGWTISGRGYPNTKEEARRMIDDLIGKVMESCGVDEKAAVKLLNES